MSEFSELIKNFNKIRDFMRDFYIFGFKTRDDFSAKSARTYDNEKRRCESYLGDNFKWTYKDGSKASFVSADCARLGTNPLFSAWKSKSFTDNDIMLHFYILNALNAGDKSANELTEEILHRSGKIFDLQTVRGKCNEYVDLGILAKEKCGKEFKYKLSTNAVAFDDELLDAAKFFQGGVLGVIGNYILDNANCANDLFVFKHHYIANTLEDGVLLDILAAMHERRTIEMVMVGTKNRRVAKYSVVPAKILCSFWSGRRYLCAYIPSARKFSCFRLDAIKSIVALDIAENYEKISDSFARNFNKVWGTSFAGDSRNEKGFSLTLFIDESKEGYIINRVIREGRGGVLERIGENTFRFTKEVFDANEAITWVKTFIGRIISFEASAWLEEKLHKDIRRMAEMYGVGGAE